MINLIRLKPIKYKFKKIAPCITHYLGVLPQSIRSNRRQQKTQRRSNKTIKNIFFYVSATLLPNKIYLVEFRN